jgi:hypothetical protein
LLLELAEPYALSFVNWKKITKQDRLSEAGRKQ